MATPRSRRGPTMAGGLALAALLAGLATAVLLEDDEEYYRTVQHRAGYLVSGSGQLLPVNMSYVPIPFKLNRAEEFETLAKEDQKFEANFGAGFRDWVAESIVENHILKGKKDAARQYYKNKIENREGGLKIIGAGRARTGTQTVQAALAQLGLNTAHGEEVFGHKEAMVTFSSGFNRLCKRNVDHTGFLGSLRRMRAYIERKKWNATLDAPFWTLSKEFTYMFPKAKVLLTVHPGGAKGWMKSVEFNMRVTREHPTFMKGALLKANATIFFGCDCMLNVFEPITDLMRQRCMKEYDDYNNYVASHLEPERILVYNVTQGWAPLCDFLGASPCPDVPFPKNDLFKFIDHSPNGMDELIKYVKSHPEDPQAADHFFSMAKANLTRTKREEAGAV